MIEQTNGWIKLFPKYPTYRKFAIHGQSTTKIKKFTLNLLNLDGFIKSGFFNLKICQNTTFTG